MLYHREVISNQKETSCLPLLNAGFEPWKSETPNNQQTEWTLINWRNYRIKQILELNSPSLWWVSILPTWLHDIHICCLILIVLRDREMISNWKWTSCHSLPNAGFGPWKSETPNPQQNSTARPMMSEHSAYSASLPVLVHPWFWWHRYLFTYRHTYMYTYMFVVANFDALAQAIDVRVERRQVVFLCWLNAWFEPGSLETNLLQT